LEIPEGRQSELSIGMALEILTILASAMPAGLTIHEIVLRLGRPAAAVIRTIAVMHRRQWLRTNPQGVFSVGRHLLDESSDRSLS
jgi:DNA-binding IclR family transcriptional regulator